MDFKMAALLLGGLGMFLYGMKIMSDGLENAAGDRMRRTLEVLTTNRLSAVGVGAAVTALIQSSSATTVMAVGFVNAGLMSLVQATGVIMGANIGTTITAQLIAFQLSDIAPLILFAGTIMSVFVKKKRIKRIGMIALGFGFLFVGISFMSDAMVPLRDNETFTNYLINFNNPLLGVIIGALFTAVLQSSSASIGILQALAMTGLIGLDSAVYIILGQNIGTCATAVLSAIGTSANSKRTAGIHLLFNIVGSLIFLLIIAAAPGIVDIVESISRDNIPRQIANFHTLFNVTVTVLLFPFASLLVKAITRMVPERYNPDEVEKRLLYLDERIAQTPGIALGQTLKEINRVGDIVNRNLTMSLEAFFEKSEEKAQKVFEAEAAVDFLTDSIANYLIEFPSKELSEHDLRVMGSLHHVIIDMERISDHAENIAEFAIRLSERRKDMTPEANEELMKMSEKTKEILEAGLEAFKLRDPSKLDAVDSLERQVDMMEKEYMKNHVDRLQFKSCEPESGVIFTNMVSSLERVADHANNIAETVAEA